MEKNNSNQWETEGDCTKCRRQSYCSKPCKLNKGMVKTSMRAILAKAAMDAFCEERLAKKAEEK